MDRGYCLVHSWAVPVDGWQWEDVAGLGDVAGTSTKVDANGGTRKGNQND